MEYSQKKIAVSEFHFNIVDLAPGVAGLFTRIKKGHNAMEVSLCSAKVAKTSLSDEMLGSIFQLHTFITPHLCQTYRQDLSDTNKWLAVGSLEPCVDGAYALNLVKKKGRIISLQFPGLPGIMYASNQNRASKSVFIQIRQSNACESNLVYFNCETEIFKENKIKTNQSSFGSVGATANAAPL